VKPFSPKIRTALASDAGTLASIYNYYIENTIITFEVSPISNLEMLKRIQQVLQNGRWIVIESEGKVLGYAYSDLWNNRSAYEKTREVWIYLDNTITGHGIGKMIYKDLIYDARKKGHHTLIGGISLPNEASIKLHEHFGFKQAAHYREVGFKFGKWIDVCYWQLILDSD
jgi:L-amino acid N-acyltransferase YncA